MQDEEGEGSQAELKQSNGKTESQAEFQGSAASRKGAVTPSASRLATRSDRSACSSGVVGVDLFVWTECVCV